MYAIKVSWAGQAFALAASNEPVGRKSRIRRSKEERKGMVESFIKRYQILNDGSFPSLNLTHKEVGGSFYTVREIVREIIQENKVLGPARYGFEAQKDDAFAEDYSLGLVSDPQVLLSMNELPAGLTGESNCYSTNPPDLDSVQCSSKLQDDEMSENSSEPAWSKLKSERDPQDVSSDEMTEDSVELARRKSLGDNEKQYAGLEPPFNKLGQCINETCMGSGQFANGTHTNGVFRESDKLSGEESAASEASDRDKQMELVGACNAKLTLPTQELIVETFPLRPAIKEIDDMSTTSTGSQNINRTSNKLGTKHAEISNGVHDLDKDSSSDSLSDTVTVKGVDVSEHPMCEPGMVVQHVAINDTILQHEDAVLTNMVGKLDEFQSGNAPKGMACKESGSSGTSENINNGPAFAVANGNSARRDNKVTSGVSPTVDRIDLESWASKNTTNHETNPLLAFFKAFVSAFVKFWSE